MKHIIINTGDYLIVVDDSEIKEDDYYLFKWGGEQDIQRFKDQESDRENHKYLYRTACKKIIAHLPINSPILEGVDILPPLEDEVEKLAKKDAVSIFGNDFSLTSLNHQSQFKSGYNKAKEKYKYTEEDLIDFTNWLFKWCEYNKYRKLIDGVKPYGVGEFISDKDMFDKFLNEKSLQQQKTPVAFECEMVDFEVDMGLGEECVEFNQYPKTTTNSQGLTQWVGEYVY